jgi:surface antigen
MQKKMFFLPLLICLSVFLCLGCDDDSYDHEDTDSESSDTFQVNDNDLTTDTMSSDDNSKDSASTTTSSDTSYDDTNYDDTNYNDTDTTQGPDTNSEDQIDTEIDTNVDTDSQTDTDFTNDTETQVESFNICDEEVPDRHYIDGIPAYAQCQESETSSIWTNDGINTSTEQIDSTWIRTQRSGGYQCTEFARRYLYFVWDVTSVPNGNAGTWCDGDPPAGLEKTMTPTHGDIIVFAPGSCGASLEYGHVAVVDTVDFSNSTVNFVEQNRSNRRTCAINTAACFLHALANDN